MGAKRLPVGIAFSQGPIFRFFTPQGRYVAPIKVKFGKEEQTVGESETDRWPV